MATLSKQDYGEIMQALYRWGDGKEELKALPGLPNRATMQAIFQAIEDFWEGNKAALKADMDAAAGFTLSPALATKVGKAWLLNKMNRGG